MPNASSRCKSIWGIGAVLRRLALLAIAIALVGTQARADEIVTIDRQRITGKITEEGEKTVRIQTVTGEVAIPRSRVQSISRAQISETEALGDLAMDRKAFYEALDLYQKAQSAAPDSAELAGKIQAARHRILEQESERFDSLFAQASQQSDQGNQEAARQTLRSIIEQTPKDSPTARKATVTIAFTYYRDALALEDRAEYSTAMQKLDTGIQEYPDGAMLHLLKAQYLHKYMKDPVGALAEYEKGIELARKHLAMEESERKDLEAAIPAEARLDQNILNDFRYEKAEMLASTGSKKEAADEFLKLFQEDPTRYSKAAKPIVDIYTDGTVTLDSEEVLKQLDVALNLDSGSARAWFLKGRIYFDRNDWDKAIEAFGEAIARDSLLRDAHLYRARAYLRKGEPVLARKDLEAEVKILESYAALTELGEVMLMVSDYENALAKFDRAIQVDIDKYPAYIGRARAYRLQAMATGVAAAKKDELFQKVEKDLQFVLNKNSKLREAIIEAGRYLSDRGMYSEAKEHFKGVIDALVEAMDKEGAAFKNADRILLVEAYIGRGEASLNNGENNQAQADFEEALKVDPSSALAYNKLGLTAQKMGENDKARENYEKAIAMNPGNPDFEISYGMFLHQHLKEHENAKKHYQAFLDKGGVDPRVKDWMRECQNAIDGAKAASSK